MNKVLVNLKNNSYPICIGRGILDDLGSMLSKEELSKKCAVITNPNINKLYGDRVKKSLESVGFRAISLEVPDCETSKSLKEAEKLYVKLLDNQLDRNSCIIALGGGVVGDLTGFIAATYMRGISLVQVPTTLLAQVDSSLGGKVGVNFSGKKNMVGSFYQPRAVVSDVALLKSLPPAEMRNGMAEVIKYALAMDNVLFHALDQKKGKLTTAELKDIVVRCCRLKAGIVEADETERSGERAILNFGHTVGHALEAATELHKLSHGEAVAIGMMAAARISEELGMLDRSDVPRIENLLLKFGLPTYCWRVNPDDLIAAIRFDKKTTLGETGWVLLKGIGRGIINQPVKEEVVGKVLAEICQ